MGRNKNMLSIHKEMEKKEYAESPLGKIEKQLRNFYEGVEIKKWEKLPEHLAEQVFEIREENEKKQLEYIDQANKKHKQFVDEMLLEAMTKELEIIKKHNDK